MLNAKLSFMVVFWRDVICVEFVLKVKLVKHSGICTLKERGKGKQTVYLIVYFNSLKSLFHIWNQVLLFWSLLLSGNILNNYSQKLNKFTDLLGH